MMILLEAKFRPDARHVIWYAHVPHSMCAFSGWPEETLVVGMNVTRNSAPTQNDKTMEFLFKREFGKVTFVVRAGLCHSATE